MIDQTPQNQEVLTVKSVLEMIWQADHFPRDHRDLPESDRLIQTALSYGHVAVSMPGDPPGFRHLLNALLDPALPKENKEDVISAIHMLFDPVSPYL